MNYGWAGSADNWYTLDSLYYPDPTGTLNDEQMIESIYPAQALGPTLSGTYTLDSSFPYRYFDQDAIGNSATFASGQYLQFLRGTTVKCSANVSCRIRFDGSDGANTYLFTQGDTSRGIHIYNGWLRLGHNGGIVLP